METRNGYKNFAFGEFRIENESLTLWRNGQKVHLPKRPFFALVFLIENRDRVVSRDELLGKFWDGHDVYDDALRKTVGAIRQALDDTSKPPRFIETRYGSGYRFIGELDEESSFANGNQKHDGLAADLSTNGTGKSQEELASPMLADETKIAARNFPYVLVAVSIASIFIFASLGFYAYLPNGKENPPSNSVGEAAAQVRSIAVLPFRNLTGDANNEYFSDGVTESIIIELSRVKEFRTFSPGSTSELKGREIDRREIGTKLNVDALLEGSIQKKGDSISASVKLISTQDGRVLWTSQVFERPFALAYELQDTISCNIAIELRAEFCGTGDERNTRNPDAYEAYLKGRYHWNKRTAEGIKQSIEFYEQAIRLDSKYELAYAGLAESYMQGIWHVPFASKEVLPRAEAAARRSLELNDTLAEGHTALANVHALNWKWSEADRELQRAIEINPRYARSHHVQAFLFLTVGRNDEAIAAIERARELDPLNLVINTDKAQLLFAADRTDEAFRQWEKALDLDPNFALAHEHIAAAYQVLGDERATIEESAKAMELRGQAPEKISAYRQTALKYGIKTIYRKELKDLLSKETRGDRISPVSPALFYAWLGEKDEAFEYLEKAYRERSAEIILLPSPLFANLRSDPRYADLLKRIISDH